jgi:tetratricopeptide (TPR) repeat protein
LITGLITAYFIHNIFVFDNIISYILFFSILAYIGVRFDHTEEMKTKTEDKKSSIIKNVDDRVVLYGPFIIVILSASLYYFNFQYIKANFAIIRGLSPQQESGDTSPVDALNRSLAGFKDAADIGGIATMESREQLAQQTLNLISQIRQANLPQNEQTLPLYKLVYDFIETTKIEYKDLIDSQKNKDPRSLSIYAAFLRSISDNEEALKFSKLAYESAPMKQTIAIDYIQTLLVNKNYAEALDISEKIYNSDKAFDQAKSAYALALAYNGRFDEAISILPEIKDNLDLIKAKIGK